MLALSGCATLGPVPVGPDDIPTLQESVAQDPGNGTAKIHLGAALATAGRYDEAIRAAEEGLALTPSDPVGALVIGQCLEDDGDFDGALQVYGRFMDSYGDARGAGAVAGRRVIALQAQAREQASVAISGEEDLLPAESPTVGILPFLVDGDPTYEALSVGLAHMVTTDLALLQRFPLVERVQLNALLQELELPPELLDPTSAARTGRLLRASRMVLGTLSVPMEEATHLGGTIVLETGEQVEPLALEGDLRDLFSLEKRFALQVAGDLGYQLSEAERQRVLENQPASLMAFLAFSRGLWEEDRGNFTNAAAYYREAVRVDPDYEEARDRLQGAVGADALSRSSRGEVIVVARRLGEPLSPPPGPVMTGAPGPNPTTNALASAVLDIASHQPERATLNAGSANPAIDLVPEEAMTLPILTAVISIMIILP
jgi:tetratricopeptide (TPR) repeat protein